MKPLSACTTPRRLIVPISRHFLPLLQPEPPAWLTTGLMKGSRLPFAVFLLSGTACCSLAAFSPSPFPVPLPATLAAAGGLLLGATTAGFRGAPCLAATTGTGFAGPALFAPAELAAAFKDGDFTGLSTATPLGFAVLKPVKSPSLKA